MLIHLINNLVVNYNNQHNSKQKMKSRLSRGLILIVMMFGHNYVLNQAQSMQSQLQEIHELDVTQFNFLYSIPSAFSILFIIPLGILYDNYSQRILLFGAFCLLFGQILVTIFGPGFESINHSFLGLIIGRIFEGAGAEVLYMIQGNLATTWMSHSAGLVFILPEIGEILNVFITPVVSQNYGILTALIIGLVTCSISFFACILLYRYINKSSGQVQLRTSSPKATNQQSSQKNIQLPSHTITNTIKSKQMVKIGQFEEQQQNIPEIEIQQQVPTQLIRKEEPKSIIKAGKVFWLMLALCSINQCLYFPFLDNANVLIQNRFCIPHKFTGFYLCIPFVSAIITTLIAKKYIITNYQRKDLIVISSILPLIGHFFIYINENCESTITLLQQIYLVVGLIFFGMGLGAYYSVSFPSIGLTIPEAIRGAGYACLCFCQTLSMTVIPQVSGLIIQQDEQNNDNFVQGYKNSSLFFVGLCVLGVAVSLIVYCNIKQNSFSYDDYENSKVQEQTNNQTANNIQMKTIFTNDSESIL